MTSPVHVPSSCDLSDEDLERYMKGHVRDKAEVTRMEDHLVDCSACAERSEAIADYLCTLKETRQPLVRERAREAGR